MASEETETGAAESSVWDVPEELHGERLDLCLTALIPEMSRTRAQKLIKTECIRINGKTCAIPKMKVASGDRIEAFVPAAEDTEQAHPEEIPLNVLYEDGEMLVIDKAPGMVVHPAAGNWTGTVVNAVLGRFPEILNESDLDPLRPGIVHRLDKDTSGCLVIAKTPKALRRLSRAFAEHEVEKTYAAIVHGWPKPAADSIKTAFGRDPADRKKMAVLRPGEGREAHTAYQVMKTGFFSAQKVALLKVRIFTGRTHQIRVHLSYRNHPVLGDALYSRGRQSSAPRQMLHAWKLKLKHPFSGEELSFEAPFPPDFRQIADSIADNREGI